jgi:hypothetical protein
MVRLPDLVGHQTPNTQKRTRRAAGYLTSLILLSLRSNDAALAVQCEADAAGSWKKGCRTPEKHLSKNVHVQLNFQFTIRVQLRPKSMVLQFSFENGSQ